MFCQIFFKKGSSLSKSYIEFSCFDYNNLIDASSLRDLDISECTNLSFMFCGCHGIKDFNFLSHWDISKCKIFDGIFIGCSFSNLNFLSYWKMENANSLKAIN